jgi:hypothetical protein
MLKGLAALFFGKGKTYPPALSSQARAEGRRLIWRFYSLNGVSVALLMENVLILYALRNHVSEPLVAVLSSFVHLTMPFMIMGKLTASKIGLTRTWALGWFLRYVSASFMILAPFIAPYVPQSAVSMLILASAFGFGLFRSMGVVANSPMEGEVTSPENRGNFVSGNHLRVNLSQVLTMLLVITVIRFADELWVYQILIGTACLTGVYASSVLARVPESEVPRTSARIPFTTAFKTLWNVNRSRKLLFAWSAALVAYMMVIPFMMIGVKSGYGISDSYALTFSLILLTGGIVSSVVNGMIADQVGPRPIMLLNACFIFIPALIWAAAPTQFMPVLVGIGFFIAGYAKFGLIMGLSHYFLSIVSGTDRVGSTLFLRVVSGAAAGLAGTVVGGGLLSWFEMQGMTGIVIYRYYFRIILFVLLCVLLTIRSLDKLKEWKVTSVLSLLASPKDVYTIHLLKRLREQQGSTEDVRTIKRLRSMASSLSEQDLRAQLDSPLLSVRVNALQALSTIDFSSETEKAIMEQVSVGEHTTAWIAAEILGHRKATQAVDLLRRGLESSDHFLQGKCMVALVRLADRENYGRIITMFDQSDNPRIVIHGAKALSLMDDPDMLYNLLEKALDPQLPDSVTDEVLTTAASMVGMQQRFYQFLQRFNKDRQLGAAELLSDLNGELFGPDDLNLLRRSAQEESGLSVLTTFLQSKATKLDGNSPLCRFFRLHENRDLPVKTAFCIALIISVVSSEPSLPAPDPDRTM